MKTSFITLIIVIGLFLLAGCGANEAMQQPEQEQDHSTDSTDKESSGEIEGKDSNAEVIKNKEEDQTEPMYEIADDSSVVPLGEDTNEKVVLLTIDDVPDKHALEMANTLKKLDVNAIFFVNGHFLETPEQRDMLKQIHEMGFVIGNHTYSHPNLKDLTDEEQTKEIVRVSDQIEEIIGEKPLFFRAPHGSNTEHSKQVVKDEGMVLMNWTYGYDYFKPYMDAKKLTSAMITGEGPEVGVDYSLLKPGANLLMHDREWTNEALENIVNGLRDKGYEMVDPHLIKTL